MDPNSDLNMLSDPEHPQALEHHVQLKAGMYSPSSLLLCLNASMFKWTQSHPSCGLCISETIFLCRWAAFSWCGPQAVSCRAAEGVPATGSQYGRLRAWVWQPGGAVRAGALRRSSLGNRVCCLQRRTEPGPACIPCHQQETEI